MMVYDVKMLFKTRLITMLMVVINPNLMPCDLFPQLNDHFLEISKSINIVFCIGQNYWFRIC